MLVPHAAGSVGFTAVNQSILDMLPAAKPKHAPPGHHRRPAAPEHGSSSTRPSVKRRSHGRATSEDWRWKRAYGSCWTPWRHFPSPGVSGWPVVARWSRSSPPYPGLAPDRLEFLGNLEGADLYAALCSCDATLVPLEAITEGGVGVFPFKVLEYLVADTHIISTPLPPVGELDLTFVQRWDGELSGLIDALDGAETAYREERTRRSEAARLARSQLASTAPPGCSWS